MTLSLRMSMRHQRMLFCNMKWTDVKLLRLASSNSRNVANVREVFRIKRVKVENQHSQNGDDTSNSCLLLEVHNSGQPSQQGTSSLRVPLIWLRDHSRDSSSFDRSTNQRKSSMTDIFNKSQLSTANEAIKYDSTECVLKISWRDGVESIFEIDDLLKWTMGEGKTSRDWKKSLKLWDRSKLQKPPTIQLSNFRMSEFVSLFVQYGIVMISGVDPVNPEATRRLCETIAPLHNTFYGDFWTFGNEDDNESKTTKSNDDEQQYEDTAYGNEEIGPHTDGTYFDATPGIQVFHCLKPATKGGGETILVDGFAVAEQIRSQNVADFDLLTTAPIEHHYVEGGSSPSNAKIYSRCSNKPVIEIDREGMLKQIRYNPYDRAPMRITSTDDIIKFYKAYERLSKLVHDTKNQLEISLKPGNVIFIDNFRVLHARKAFQGERRMCGCYLSRENFIALRRCLLEGAYQKLV